MASTATRDETHVPHPSNRLIPWIHPHPIHSSQTLLLAAAFVAAALYCVHELNRAVANPDASAFALLTRVRACVYVCMNVKSAYLAQRRSVDWSTD